MRWSSWRWNKYSEIDASAAVAVVNLARRPNMSPS
jgi:hypothetical protein